MKKYDLAVEKYSKLIHDCHDFVWKNPETGYKEFKTSAYLEAEFEKLGYTLTRADGITGFITDIDTGREGPTVLICGELDSLICADHPESDPETGAVHCCGHSAQCAALLGIAAALKEPGILDDMCGKIRLCAVPAEELIEIEYRKNLISEGKISYMGGKPEFLKRGLFDGVDLAFMVHTAIGENFTIRRGMSVGCVAKKITFKGRSSHAGGSPWNGINALYAANLGLNAANALRETFREQDYIRFHPIITAGGNAVNAIPDRVIVESYVRGISYEAIKDANSRINRALTGAALSMGANVDIEDIPGYSPVYNNAGVADVAEKAFRDMFPERDIVILEGVGTGSTDMGDLSTLMPILHPYAPGAEGFSHGSNYRVANVDDACVNSAKWQIAMLDILLRDNAAEAKKILDNFTPYFKSKEEYFEYMDTFSRNGDRIEYSDGEAKVSL